MGFPKWLFVAALSLLLLSAGLASAVEIPAYTANVVDPAGMLDSAERQAINDRLQQIRQEQHIWGAVYLLPSLEGESIEDLSARAFKQWQLGQRGVDNGLLLVLATGERRSRFEVGYGLEASLPDIAARHALDDALAPKMRQGQTAEAIIAAFDFMAAVADKDPAAIAALGKQTGTSGDRLQSGWLRGLIAWIGLVAVIWLLPPARRRWMQLARARLIKRDPRLANAPEDIVARDNKNAGCMSTLFLPLFLTVNPGVFVLMLSAIFMPAFVISILLELLIFGIVLGVSGRRYRSPQDFRSFLAAQKRKRDALIRKGHVMRDGDGNYQYTPAYHAHQSSSSSSSSSDSGSSSSSGGGSSGGGGASSSW